MIGNIYLRCSFIIIITISNSCLATKDINVRNMQSLDKSDEKQHYDKGQQRLNEDYCRDADPVNYDEDYYPYRSYLYESNNDEQADLVHPQVFRKHKMKRRGQKEKNFVEKEVSTKNNHINSSKSRIKTLKRCKTKVKAKLRRSAMIKEVLENKNLFDSKRDPFSPPIDSLKALQDADAIYPFPKANNISKVPKEPNQKASFTISGGYANGAQRSNKQPHKFMLNRNRSQIINKFNRNVKEERYTFTPEEFNLKSLSKVLGEVVEIKRPDFPQCPAKDYERNESELKTNKEQNKNSQILNSGADVYNIYNELLRKDNIKRYENSDTRNAARDDNSVGEARAKREQKVKTITLTFPIVDNLESLIPPKVTITANTLNESDEPNESAPVKKIELESSAKACSVPCTTEEECCTTCPTTCSTTCSTPSTCPHPCAMDLKRTGFKRSTPSPLIKSLTTSSFKEINEGSKIIKDLSNYVANLLQPIHLVNATVLGENKSVKEALVVPDTYGGKAIIPVSIRKVIKVKHNDMKRSNDISDNSQDIYIVQLSKDSLGKVKGLPLKSQKRIFSIPYPSGSKRLL